MTDSLTHSLSHERIAALLYPLKLCCEILPIKKIKHSASVRVSLTICLVDSIQIRGFVKLLSNFTKKLLIIRGGSLLVFRHKVNGQGQIWHSFYSVRRLHKCDYLRVFEILGFSNLNSDRHNPIHVELNVSISNEGIWKCTCCEH